MKRILKISTLPILCAGFLWLLFAAFKTKDPLTQDQAIQLAEQFIVDNGYTNLPADKSKLHYELFDPFENNVDSILKHRKNELQPKAFCISENKQAWHVGFLSTQVDLNQLDSIQRQGNLAGRAVIVLKNGKEIKIAHQAPLFSRFKKL
jgi:hypothetical protein